MPISFKCGSCGQALKVKDELANRRVKCPKCAQPAQVPAAQPAAVSADPEIRIVEETPPSPAPSPAPVGHRAGGRLGSSPRKPILTPPESEMPYILRGLAGGLLAAVLGAFVWYLLARGINAKIGYVAWGIGWATGFGVVVLSGGKGGPILPFLGAGTALFGWVLGEYLIYRAAVGDFEKEMANLGGKAAEKPELQELLHSVVSNISFMDYLKGSFEGIDILFIILAVVTGFGVPRKMGAA